MPESEKETSGDLLTSCHRSGCGLSRQDFLLGQFGDDGCQSDCSGCLSDDIAALIRSSSGSTVTAIVCGHWMSE